MLSSDKLKFLRYTHGVTQKQMAKWCDVTVRYIAGIEGGEYLPAEDVYNAWIDCCYGVGQPIKRDTKNRKKSVEEEE